MTALLEYLDQTALLEYIDLLNRYSGGPSWGLLGPLSGWGPGQNSPVAPPPPPPPLLWAALQEIQLPLHVRSLFVFNLDNPVAPRRRNQNFNSEILRASGARPSKEAPGTSASVSVELPSEAINRTYR